MLPQNAPLRDMYIFGNRDITCTDNDSCSGFALFLSVETMYFMRLNSTVGSSPLSGNLLRATVRRRSYLLRVFGTFVDRQ